MERQLPRTRPIRPREIFLKAMRLRWMEGGGNQQANGWVACFDVPPNSTAPPHLLCVGAPACQWTVRVPEWRGVWLFLTGSRSCRFDSLKWAERHRKYLLWKALEKNSEEGGVNLAFHESIDFYLKVQINIEKKIRLEILMFMSIDV